MTEIDLTTSTEIGEQTLDGLPRILGLTQEDLNTATPEQIQRLRLFELFLSYTASSKKIESLPNQGQIQNFYKNRVAEGEKPKALFSLKTYKLLERQIDAERLSDLEDISRQKLNYVDSNPEKPRENTVALINGLPGSGKGTTLDALEIERAVETGSTGTSAYANGFENWKLVMKGFDQARFNGEMVPPKFIKLVFLTEMLAQREILDQAGRINDPVFASGYPRSPGQAKFFEGIRKVKSVEMRITRETAVKRTLSRIVDALVDEQEEDLREDDFKELEINEDDKKISLKEIRDEVVGYIRGVVKHRPTKPTTADLLSNELSLGLLDHLTISEKGRYVKLEGTMNGIRDVLSNAGIHTTVIDCDGKPVKRVTEEVRFALGMNNGPEVNGERLVTYHGEIPVATYCKEGEAGSHIVEFPFSEVIKPSFTHRHPNLETTVAIDGKQITMNLNATSMSAEVVGEVIRFTSPNPITFSAAS